MTIASISFVFVGDKASSNEAFLNMVLAVIDIVSEKEDVRLTGFYEWCVLHRFGIIWATLLKRFQVGKHLYSLSCLAHGQAAQSSQEASGRLGLNRPSLQ